MTWTGLFRNEVVNAQRQDTLGTVLIAAPWSRWLLGVIATSLSAAVLLFLFFGHYTRRESVSGQLVPSAGVLNVSAPSAGTVRKIYVKDGQHVKAGDLLVEITTDQSSIAFGDTHIAVEKQLAAQRDRLHADLLDQHAMSDQQALALRAKISLLGAELDRIAEQLAIQQQQMTSNETLLDRIKPLESKGYVSALQIQQQESAVFEAKSQFKALVRQQLDIRQQQDSAKQQLAQLPLDMASKQNETQRQLATVAQSEAQNETERAIVLRAPGEGLVSAVLLKEGQMASTSQPLLSILPDGASLQAQLLVSSRAVGFIEPGNQVVLRYQAFPYQKFGQQYGRIIDISRSALTPAEIAALEGKQSSEPLYRVTVALDSQKIMAYGEMEDVKSGMALDADILMERRRLIEWAFEPLYGIGQRLKGGVDHG